MGRILWCDGLCQDVSAELAKMSKHDQLIEKRGDALRTPMIIGIRPQRIENIASLSVYTYDLAIIQTLLQIGTIFSSTSVL
jgi:hypothetical protein